MFFSLLHLKIGDPSSMLFIFQEIDLLRFNAYYFKVYLQLTQTGIPLGQAIIIRICKVGIVVTGFSLLSFFGSIWAIVVSNEDTIHNFINCKKKSLKKFISGLVLG